MSDRYTTAEEYFASLLTGQAGLTRARACSVQSANRKDSTPCLNFFLESVKFDRMLAQAAGNISMMKKLTWVGILHVGAGGSAVDDARLAAYPIIGDVRSLIDGAIFNYVEEFVGPCHTTDEGPVQVGVGEFAWAIMWEHEMQFTKGIA